MSKSDKEKILRNLNDWSLSNKTDFIGTSWQFCGGPGPFIELEEEEAKEVKENIIKMVKNDARSWRVEEKKIFHNSESFFLVHQSVKEIEFGLHDEIIRNFGKIHNKKGFSEEEWKEIENLSLGNKETHAIIRENNTKISSYVWKGLLVVFLVIVIILIWRKVKSVI